MSTTNNTSLRNILVNLDVISKVEKMDKLNTYYKNFVREKPGMFTSLARWIRNDDQIKTCNGIEDLINSCMNLLKGTDLNEASTIKLLRYMLSCRIGLENLRHTYIENDTTNAMLTLLIETLDELPKMFPEQCKLIEQKNTDSVIVSISTENPDHSQSEPL